MHHCNVEWNRFPDGFPADMPGEALAGTLRARNAFPAPTPAQARLAALDPLTTALWAG